MGLASLVALALMLCPAPAQAAGGADTLLVPRAPSSLVVPPPGYRLSARDAVSRASSASEVGRHSLRPGLVASAFLFGEREWQISFYRDRREVVRVMVDGRSGRLDHVWTGPQIEWPLARGAHGPKARRLHLLLVLSGLLFLLPLVDPRRLLRIVHLDLVVLLSFGVSHFFVARGQIDASVPLAYPPLLYLVGRLAWLALRPADDPGTRDERLTWLSPRALGIALVALLAARYAYDAIDSGVNDVGYASVLGANSINGGVAVYGAGALGGHLDTYGPVAYLLYVPFEMVMPLKNLAHANADAARPAAIVFDLITVGALFALGRRLREGARGVELGLVLAWGFAAYPWTLFVLSQNTNDGIVPMFLALALLAVRSPAGRGALLGLAAAAKFAPLALAGLFARAGRERTLRPIVIYGAAFGATIGLLVWAYLPDSGLRGFWDATIGFQLSRSSPFSIWGLHPGWEPLHTPLTVLVAAMAAAALVLPRERSVPALAAAGAAILYATQLTARHWFYFYLVWALPYALVALFSRSYAGSVRNSGSSSESAVASNSS